MKKRMVSLFLAAVMCAGLLPTVALAGDGDQTGGNKAVMAGTSGIKDPTANGSTEETYYTPNGYIYFGQNNGTPIKWRVLDADKANNGAAGMFLLSEHLLASDVYFQAPGTYHQDNTDSGGVVYRKGANHLSGVTEALAIAWQESTAQTWAKDFAGESGNSVEDAFNSGEQAALLATTKADAVFTNYGKDWGASELKGDKVFFLSTEELAQYVGNYHDAPGLTATPADNLTAGGWWLRSARDGGNFDMAGAVAGGGSVIYGNIISETHAARPAFNLDSSKVLFTSPAGSAKPDFGEVQSYSGNEWKLTLKDTNATIATGNNSVALKNNVTELTEGYGENEVAITIKLGANVPIMSHNTITAAITNDSGELLCYGKLTNYNGNDTTGEVAYLPTGLPAGNYTISVYGEQWNGANKTDYATAVPLTCTFTVSLPQEQKPNATFTATGYDSGTLSGVASGMKYSVDGGSSWKDITGTSATITGVTVANGIKVYQPGNGTTTADSDTQPITVTRAEKPDLIETQPNTIDGKGSIPTTNVHEYSTNDGASWTACEGGLTGLAAGTYLVRVKASGTTLASESTTIKIKDFEPSKKPTPNAAFTATGYDSGTLSGVGENMKYKIGSGTWTDITSDSNIPLTGLSPCTISVVKKGNGTTTIDSDPKPITVTRAATPSLTETQPNTINGTGSIPTTAAHEYSTDNGNNWTPCTGTLTDLSAGDYLVRVKAKDATLASDYQKITIKDAPSGSEGGGIILPTHSTLTFETNGGSQVGSLTKPYGEKVGLTGYVPVREGYVFDGWFADKALTQRITEITLDGNKTVYAGWTAAAPAEQPAQTGPDAVKIPQTGDGFDLAGLIGLMLLSAAAMAAAGATRARKRDEDTPFMG